MRIFVSQEMLFYSSCKVAWRLANVTGVTSRTFKQIYTQPECIWNRIFETEKILDFERRKNNSYVYIFAENVQQVF